MEAILNVFVLIVQAIITAVVDLCAFGGLVLIFWMVYRKQKDYNYYKKATKGTSCRYWLGENRYRGVIIDRESNKVVIRDTFDKSIVIRNIKDTIAL